MPSPEPWRLGHRPSLDGLRGVAILLVVAAHATDTWAWVPAAGAVGVSVFFALSGFLITSLLLDEYGDTGRIRLSEFYKRRAARLFPALAVFLWTMLLLSFTITPLFARPGDLLAVVFYVGNWLPAFGHRMQQVDHTWSLAVEEQFYLLFPLLVLWLIPRVSVRRLLAVVAALTAASAIWRVALVVGGSTANRVYNATDTAACLLLVGCCAAIAVHVWPPSRQFPRLVLLPLAAICALSLVPEESGARTLVPMAAALLATLAIVCLAGPGGYRGLLTKRWLMLVGKRSYALYLWHFPMLMLVTDLMMIKGVPEGVAIPTTLAASWGVTCLSWRYVEQPALRLVHRGRETADGSRESTSVGGAAGT